MAGTDEHDESFQQINDRRVMVESSDVVNETDVASVISALGSAESSSEILLYVDGNQEGVHDLIRVALNQGISPNELQQQLQNAGANITLQSLSDAQAVISLQEVRNLAEDQSSSGVLNLQTNQQNTNDDEEGSEAEGLVIGKDTDMNNLFQLANLSGALSSETVKNTSIEGQIEGQIHNDLGTVVKTEIPTPSNDNTVIEDYIIANIDSKETVKVPGEFNVGDAFYSLEEVEEALHAYEEKHEVKLYKRDVRSLEALLKRSLKLQKLDNINESLKYGQLLYCCVYGGKRKAQKMACMDESGIARYTDCKMFIRFAISDDGMKLVVNGKLETHNHDEVQSDEQNMEPRYITNAGNADEIRLGAGFVDLEELYKAIHKYETDNHVHLWRRDGRTVEALAKRAPGTARKILETNPGLRFAELRFCCSYGGRHLSDGQRDKLKASPGGMEQSMNLLLTSTSVIGNVTDRNTLSVSSHQPTPCEMMQPTPGDGLKQAFEAPVSLGLHNTVQRTIDTTIEENVLIDPGVNSDMSVDFEKVNNVSESISGLDGDFLVYPNFKRFDQAFKQYQKDTQTSFCTAHNSRDFSKFVTLEDILIQNKAESKRNDGGLPFIRWEFHSGGFPIPFLGYPFISVGHSKYDCCQGKDLNLATKNKARDERLKKLKDGVPISARTLSQPTKKMGCPVTSHCKKLYAFPNYAIKKDTKRNRSTVSLKLRKLFTDLLNKLENREEPTVPDNTELGTLVYIAKFPNSSEHKYHLEFNCNIEPQLVLPPSKNLMLGSTFNTYKDLEIAVNRYRSERNVRLYRSAEDVIRFPTSPLVFKQITYRCFHTNNKTNKKR